MVERERKLLVVSCFLCLMTVSLQLAIITVLRVGRESTQAHIAKVVSFSYFPPPPPTVYNVQLNLGGGRKRGWSTTLSSLSIFSTLWRNKSVVACLLFFDRQKEIFIRPWRLGRTSWSWRKKILCDRYSKTFPSRSQNENHFIYSSRPSTTNYRNQSLRRRQTSFSTRTAKIHWYFFPTSSNPIFKRVKIFYYNYTILLITHFSIRLKNRFYWLF